MSTTTPSTDAESRSFDAVAGLYHAWMTGLVLTLVSRKDSATAEAFMFRVFRTQHLEKFLPGLEKLGLASEPDAVAAAKYHYFSNQLGGVGVEYLEESPKKAWVRYPPPRWIWMGTALCGVPTAVNRAMLRGWHAHNGVSLGNPKLGFVCTKTTVDGQPGLEGYYHESDRDLAPDERLQFRPDESAPRIDRASLPQLDAESWPDARRRKASRNYAMEYIRTALPVLTELVGPEEARYLIRLSGLQIGMHGHRDALAALGQPEDGTLETFLEVFEQLLRGQGDAVARSGSQLTQTGWRLFRGRSVPHEAVAHGWSALWEGVALAHDRFLALDFEAQLGGAEPRFSWNVRLTG